MLKEKSGIELGPTKQNMVYARLAKRLRKLGFKTFRDYIEFIGTPAGVDELGTTLNALTKSEEHTSELQSLMRISYAVFCLKKKNHYTHDEYDARHMRQQKIHHVSPQSRAHN